KHVAPQLIDNHAVTADTIPAQRTAEILEEAIWNVWMRADRDGVLELPGRGAREVPDLREACDLVGFSYYSATGVGAEGEQVPYPPSARVGTRRGAKGWASSCAGCTRSCRTAHC